MDESDLAFAVIKHLVVSGSGEVGRSFDIRPLVRDFMERRGHTIDQIKDILSGLHEQGYAKSRSLGAIKEWGTRIAHVVPLETYQMDQLPDGFMFHLTWPGKVFYTDHIKKGVLSEREWKGFLVIGALTVISTIATVWQLVLLLGNNPDKQGTAPQGLDRSTTLEYAPRKNAPVVIHVSTIATADTVRDTIYLTIPVFHPDTGR